jgi:hypothetical protein
MVSKSIYTISIPLGYQIQYEIELIFNVDNWQKTDRTYVLQCKKKNRNNPYKFVKVKSVIKYTLHFTQRNVGKYYILLQLISHFINVKFYSK